MSPEKCLETSSDGLLAERQLVCLRGLCFGSWMVVDTYDRHSGVVVI